MNPDLPDDVEIGYSSSRMLPLVALAAAATTPLLGTGIASGYGSIGDYSTLVGYADLAVFGVANEFIRRGSIADASDDEYRQLEFVALNVNPALERQLFITSSRYAMLNANRAIGDDGVAISSSGSTADFDTLIDACTAHDAAANDAGAARVQKGAAASEWIAQCA